MRAIFLFASFFLFGVLSFGQGQMYMTGNFNPDSLTSITVTGKVIADSSMMNGMYFLDVNNDNTPDYMLIFGPFWYMPDSSSAVRPNTGDIVTITGGLYSGVGNYAPMVVVYSINGNFWRSPYDSYWNEMGTTSMMGGYGHQGMGYAFGFNHDSLQSVSLSGTVLTDSTFMYNHFYLDTNSDGTPDYILNFGPPWYSSSSGIKLPENGTKVSINGWEVGTGYMNMVIVNNINGQTWRDTTTWNNNLGCGWINRNMNQGQRFYSPFDTTDWMEVNPGWHQGGMMGGNMMQDSLYCQIMEVFPGNVPDNSGENTIAAFEVGVFNPDGMNNMMQSNRMGGSMNFNSQTNFQFHFNAIQASGYNVNNGNIKVKYWNSQSNQWTSISGASFNPNESTVSVSQSQISNFYIVTADQATGVNNTGNNLPDNFSLKQNYPNPFNPTTTIEFFLKQDANVTLDIYNILGQKVTSLLSKHLNAGVHSIQFNGLNLPSGIYFCRLSNGVNNKIIKMELLK